MSWLDNLMVLLPLIMVALALALASAVRRRIACGGSRLASPSPGAGDPFVFAFGDVAHADREIANYRREMRADDFRAWGLPPTVDGFGRRRPDTVDVPFTFPSANAPRRKEDGGRLNPSRPAVVLTFPGRRG